MSVAQTKAARRKMKARYRGGKATKTIAESIAREREAAQRAAAAKAKK